MKKSTVTVGLMLFALLFPGCTDGMDPEASSLPVWKIAESSAAEFQADSSGSSGEQTDYMEGYVEQFRTYAYEGDTDAHYKDRQFTLEDPPENIVEQLAVSKYYYEISGEFDKLADSCGEALGLSVIDMEERFEDGEYVKEYTIYELSALTKEELLDLPESFVRGNYLNSLENSVAKYSLTEFTVVQADISMVSSQDALASESPGKEGRQFFLCGKKEGGNWKIYEIYWEDPKITDDSGNLLNSISTDEKEQLIVNFDLLFRNGIQVMNWWLGSIYDSLVPNGAEPSYLEEYYRVTDFKSIKQLKRETEKIFTQQFAEEILYPVNSGTDEERFVEDNGKLYVKDSGGWGVPYGPIKSYLVKSLSETEATLTVSVYHFGIHKEVDFDFSMVKQGERWLLNSFFSSIVTEPAPDRTN